MQSRFRLLAAALLVAVVATGIPGASAEDDPGEVEFHGVVEALPGSGLVGDWVVSGVTVHVTASTRIEEEHGPVAVGAFVEVKGLAGADGSVTATKVEVEGAQHPNAGTVNLVGKVERVPRGGSLVGGLEGEPPPGPRGSGDEDRPARPGPPGLDGQGGRAVAPRGLDPREEGGARRLTGTSGPAQRTGAAIAAPVAFVVGAWGVGPRSRRGELPAAPGGVDQRIGR